MAMKMRADNQLDVVSSDRGSTSVRQLVHLYEEFWKHC